MDGTTMELRKGDHGGDTGAGSAIGLGYLGLGLGLAELLAPRPLHGLVGVPGTPRSVRLTRALGLREIATSLGLLARSRRPAPWLWARVAGDVIDLALLGAAFRSRRTRRAPLGGAIATALGVAALDVFALARAARIQKTRAVPPVRRAITVAVSAEQAYQFWRDLGNLSAFMERVESVEALDATRSRWRARGLAGKTLDWESQIVADRPGEIIGWRSIEGSEIPNRGRVSFRAAPGGRGTEVELELHYALPGGELGRMFAFLADPALGVQLGNDLRRFKQLMETGEVVHSDASVHRGTHPARPGGSDGAAGRRT